ncbi:MAG TPA: M48 family metalloprotease [Longimicrobiales bacterium]|nr:M48 family metalloprotease [Longimicrobiales bacterium]
MRVLRTALPALALAAVSVTAGCAVNPVTGQRQLALISEGQEIEMGRQVAQEAVAAMGLVEDQALQDYVNRLGLMMARTSERPELPWSFQVVDDPTPNAFAAPGGFIFVTRGLLAMMRNEAELMGVLGHEIGHVTARHSVTMISRAQLAQIGLGVGSIISPTVARLGDVFGGGLQLLFLHYGRDAERQADDLGFRYMLEHNYDAREMVNVFAALQRSGELAGQSAVPSWLASHPYPEERIQRIQQALAELGQQEALARTRVGTDDYMARIDGLVFGENPRNGFFRDQLYLHPELRFRIGFPAQWRTQNTAQAVLAVSPQQDAVMQLTLAQGTEVEAANRFFGQQGIAASQVSRQTVNGLPATAGFFEAQTQDGTVRGFAAFIRHDNRTYQILGYSPAQIFARYDPVIRGSVGSFAVLTDQSALNVRPNRITIVRPPQSMTLAQFNQQYPSQVSMDHLAIINQLSGPNATIPANYAMKRVVTGS